MTLSTTTSQLLTGIAEVLPEIGLCVLPRGGAVHRFGADHGVDWQAGERGVAVLPAGIGAVAEQVADGCEVLATFPAAQAGRYEPFLRTALDLLGRCEQLEQDMESMNHSALQLLEQVSMLGETLPRLSAGDTDGEIAATGLKACVVAANVERAVYLRLHQATGLCEVLVHVELDQTGQGQLRPYPLEEFVPAGKGMTADVLAAGDSVVLRMVSERPLGAAGSPESLARREVLGVPVTYDTGDRRVCLGVILLFDKAGTGFDQQRSRLGSEEGQVAMSFASMLGAVIGARLSAELGKELSLAQAIQGQILPAGPATVPGFDLAGDYRTSGDVGGDYFDYVPLADGRTLVVVADVSGHNLASGMMMVSARATLRTLAAVRSDPAQLFTDLAASMYTDLTRTERFITAAGVALQPNERSVEVVSAGHNDLMLYRVADGSVTRLRAQQTVLGFVPHTEYRHERLVLEAGDCLFLYTDGVTEAVGQDGELFGEERLADVLAAAAPGSAREVVAAVLGAVQAFQQSGERGDDVTLVAIKAQGRAGGRS